MFTPQATAVNGPPPRAVMLSIAQLAEREGVSKPAVSRKVKQLVEKHGLTVERDAQGRVAGVNVAEYDHLRGRFDDPAKAQAPGKAPRLQSPTDETSNESYDEARRVKTWVEAERARIALAEEMGQLIPVAEVRAAEASCGETIANIVDRLLGYTDEMAAAVTREGIHGLRVLIKQIIFKQKTEIAAALEAAPSNSDQASIAREEIAA